MINIVDRSLVCVMLICCWATYQRGFLAGCKYLIINVFNNYKKRND